ncbi:MAG: hypothetical protein HY320_06185 [Armatimonadetes bacterium]|nr:hypothetical protein [Armatimonadota bacterium]
MEPLEPAAPDVTPPQASPPVPTPYEFDAEQSKLIAGLGELMRDVGAFVVLIGVLHGVVGGLLTVAQRRSGLVFLVQAVVAILIGLWTRSAGEHFQRITTTAGADMQHLMNALAELRRIYSLQRTLILVALILVGILLIFALVAGPSWRPPPP